MTDTLHTVALYVYLGLYIAYLDVSSGIPVVCPPIVQSVESKPSLYLIAGPRSHQILPHGCNPSNTML